MTTEALVFLGGDPRRTAIFEAVEAAVAACGESDMTVQKSQISWGNPLKFAFLSLPLRVGRGWPEGSLVLTFGLGEQVRHPKIFQSVEPYPGRWTHHVVLGGPDYVDADVGLWLKNAYAFAQIKRAFRGGKRRGNA